MGISDSNLQKKGCVISTSIERIRTREFNIKGMVVSLTCELIYDLLKLIICHLNDEEVMSTMCTSFKHSAAAFLLSMD